MTWKQLLALVVFVFEVQAESWAFFFRYFGLYLFVKVLHHTSQKET